MPSIAEIEEQIRHFINDPRKQYALLQDTAAWKLLCSCLDAIGDTEVALDAYENSNGPSDIGSTYILVYGVLQALFIQQDAVKDLCQALGINYERDPLLTAIREIRNDSAGHPTKRGAGKGQAYNVISRSSLAKAGFDLMTTYPEDRKPLFRHVDLPSLISDQRAILHATLSEVLEKLRKEEADHRAKYRDQRLQDIFPSTLGYYFQKLAEAIHGSDPPELGALHVRLIAESIESFKECLRERGILEAHESVTYLLGLLEYPIRELDIYFAEQDQSSLNTESAHIFAFFIERHMERLRAIAKEIDEKYRAEP